MEGPSLQKFEIQFLIMKPTQTLRTNGKGEGRVKAFHYATRKPVEVSWKEGVVTALSPASADQETDLWIAPPLFDIQVNGYGGVDFQRDDVSPEELAGAIGKLRRDGCSRIMLTLITEEWGRLMARLRHFRTLREKLPELRKSIAGWHIEGPFLSAQDGFRGAHRIECMGDPTADRIRELREAAGNDPVLLTLAPERHGSMEAIRTAVSMGMTVFGGHSNASRDELEAAVRCGLSGFTHFGNGCPQSHDRHDNILFRVLDCRELRISMIPDRIHVSPLLFRLAHRAMPEQNICYTTDAMAAAGAPPGRYRIGHIEVEVGEEQIVRQPGRTNFAGSALRPVDGVFRAAGMLRCPWQEVWRRASEQPAAFVGLRQELEAGAPADFCLVRMSNDQNPDRLSVCVDGDLREASAWA